MKWLRSCAAAFRFLTIIPLPSSFGCKSDDLANSTVFFPLVGVFLGCLASGGAWVLWEILPPSVAAVSLTLLLLSFSGALHLDGLADSADGFFSSRDREGVLEIMRDSRVGAMGAIALIMVLLFKFSCLSGLNQLQAVKISFLMPVAGRCTLVIMMTLLPYIRLEGGLGTLFYSRRTGFAAMFAVVALFVLSFLVQGVHGLALASLVVLVILLFSLYSNRKIGGVTGDVLGAGCEISEVSTVLFFVALQTV